MTLGTRLTLSARLIVVAAVSVLFVLVCSPVEGLELTEEPSSRSMAAVGGAIQRSASGRWFYDPNRGKTLLLSGVYTYGGITHPGKTIFGVAPIPRAKA